MSCYDESEVRVVKLMSDCKRCKAALYAPSIGTLVKRDTSSNDTMHYCVSMVCSAMYSAKPLELGIVCSVESVSGERISARYFERL